MVLGVFLMEGIELGFDDPIGPLDHLRGGEQGLGTGQPYNAARLRTLLEHELHTGGLDAHQAGNEFHGNGHGFRLHRKLHRLLDAAIAQGLEHGLLGIVQARPPEGMREHDRPAAGKQHGGISAHDEAVAMGKRQGFFQAELGECGFAGLELGHAVHEQDAAQDLPRTVGDMHPRAAFDGLTRLVVVDIGDPGIEPVARLDGAHLGEEVAGLDLVRLDIRQVDGDAVSRICGLDRLAMDLDGTDLRHLARRKDLDRIAWGRGPRPQGARGDRAGALDSEYTVDRIAHRRAFVSAIGPIRRFLDSRKQPVQTLPGLRGNRDDGCIGIGRRGKMLADVVCHEIDPFGIIYKVDLGQGHHASPDTQGLQDGDVLDGLGHDAIVRSDHQQGHVDTSRTRDHLAHEPFMARQVDYAHEAAVGQPQLREAQGNGDAALLFLGESVGIRSGQGEDERRFTMIDMPGSTEHQVRLGAVFSHCPSCRMIAGKLGRKPYGAPSPEHGKGASPNGHRGRQGCAQAF